MVFTNPLIRILPFEPMAGDEGGRFPAGVPLRREGLHPMKVFGVDTGAVLGCRKGGIPSHGFGNSRVRLVQFSHSFQLFYWISTNTMCHFCLPQCEQNKSIRVCHYTFCVCGDPAVLIVSPCLSPSFAGYIEIYTPSFQYLSYLTEVGELNGRSIQHNNCAFRR